MSDTIDLTEVLSQQILLDIVKQTRTSNDKGLFNSNSYIQDNILYKQSLNKNKIIAISAGYLHGLVLDSDGSVYSFGSNDYGQLGRVTTNRQEQLVPTKINNINKIIAIIAISAGSFHSLVLDSDGSVYSFGENEHGQLGSCLLYTSPSPRD